MERARMVLTIAREGHIWRGRASLVYYLSASMTLDGVSLLLPYIIYSHMLGLILEGFLHEELLLVLINIHRWGNTNVISLTLHEAIVCAFQSMIILTFSIPPFFFFGIIFNFSPWYFKPGIKSPFIISLFSFNTYHHNIKSYKK